MTTTQHEPDTGSVVVAVAEDGSTAALAYAAAEARALGCALHVVHVVDLVSPVPPGPAVDDLVRRADRTLAAAVRAARTPVGDRGHVSDELFHGHVVEGLLAVARDARLLVLQRRPATARRAGRGSVCAQVGSGAPVPVVCVPSDPRRPLGGAGGDVTVGVHDPVTCGPLLAVAARAAIRRGARLRVVHAVTEGDDTERALTVALLELGRERPTPEVDVEIVAARPARALVEASRRSQLLVVGRHHPSMLHGSTLGPVARAVLRRAECPVLLPTPAQSASSAEWVFAGHLE